MIFTYQPPAIPWLDIRYVDQDLIAINKPSGLLSNPGRAEITHDCALTRLQQLYPEAILVHRLDCDTSGIMVFARHKQAESWLKTQFQDRATEKIYIAEIAGQLLTMQGHLNYPLAPDLEQRPLQKVDPKGKPSSTDFQVLAHRTDSTLVELTPHTGRTHQLRVHMKALGHTILGDQFYGDDVIKAARPRLQLHAQSLKILHPKTKLPMHFLSPHPF